MIIVPAPYCLFSQFCRWKTPAKVKCSTAYLRQQIWAGVEIEINIEWFGIKTLLLFTFSHQQQEWIRKSFPVHREELADPLPAVNLMMRECPCSNITWEELGNPSPTPWRFPSTYKISWASRMDFPIPSSLWWSTGECLSWKKIPTQTCQSKNADHFWYLCTTSTNVDQRKHWVKVPYANIVVGLSENGIGPMNNNECSSFMRKLPAKKFLLQWWPDFQLHVEVLCLASQVLCRPLQTIHHLNAVFHNPSTSSNKQL